MQQIYRHGCSPVWWPRAATAKIYYHRKKSLNDDKRLKKLFIIFENKIKKYVLYTSFSLSLSLTLSLFYF